MSSEVRAMMGEARHGYDSTPKYGSASSSGYIDAEPRKPHVPLTKEETAGIFAGLLVTGAVFAGIVYFAVCWLF
ncbi:MAG: hypothetical protein JWN70_5490 [Planctomycetaceae bacterium]|nr:hypothetical protein [Planctomycetaceae bacterium]